MLGKQLWSLNILGLGISFVSCIRPISLFLRFCLCFKLVSGLLFQSNAKITEHFMSFYMALAKSKTNLEFINCSNVCAASFF